MAEHRALLRAHRALYPMLLAKQHGGCGICERHPSETRRLDMDHDHSTMRVRGLLCVRCNRTIPDWVTSDWLRAAAEYLDHPPLTDKELEWLKESSSTQP